MEEYNIYSKEIYNHLKKALPIAKTITQEYQDAQNAYQSNTDSMYIAMNKQKRLDRIESTKPDTESHSMDVKSDASSTTSSSPSEDYHYSSSSDDEEIQHDTSSTSKTTKVFSNLSLSTTTQNQHLPKPKNKSKPSINKFHLEKRKLRTPPLITLPLQNPYNNTSNTLSIMELPQALLSPTTADSISELHTTCQEYLHLSQTTSTNPIILLLIQSGRFAGAIFQGNKCLHHKVCTQYTVRRGQGGSQSNSDNRKKAKSMGAQLRRAGEEKLKLDIQQFLQNHVALVKKAALIFQSCPKTMQTILMQNDGYVHAKQEGKVRKIPLSVKRPSYDMACQVHSILMMVLIREIPMEEYRSSLHSTVESDDHQDDKLQKTEQIKNTISSMKQEIQTSSPPPLPQSPPKPTVLPLTPLHKAAAAGNVDDVTKHALKYLNNDNPYHDHVDINLRAGETQMTALHYAASSASPHASACITYLLQTCHADPCCLDTHNRPPYYLSSNDKIREAFRISRSELGEDFCSWDNIAKVGPAMTALDVQSKKQKLAEKKKRQRQRQKEKKAKERLEKARVEEEKELEQKEMEAKRVRAGLAPKKPSLASNVCDYCHQTKKGMKRSQMFQRLDFWYCSTDCVKKHQRELSANAALARFGGK